MMRKTTAGSENAASDQDELVPAAGALEFLRECRRQKRPVAVVTGASDSGKSLLVHRFLRDIEGVPVAHITAPVREPHSFLQKLLEEFGFEAFDSTASELLRLTIVFIRHQTRKGVQPVIVIEDADQLSSAIQITIHNLSNTSPDESSSALFILTAGPEFDPLTVAADLDSVYSLDTAPTASGNEPDVQVATVDILHRGESTGHCRLDRTETAIGRNGANNIRISGNFVSRFHALLIKEDDGFYVVDLNSTNGTFVNGERVTQRRLRDGDRIVIEQFELRFRDPAADTSVADDHAAASETADELAEPALDQILGRSA